MAAARQKYYRVPSGNRRRRTRYPLFLLALRVLRFQTGSFICRHVRVSPALFRHSFQERVLRIFQMDAGGSLGALAVPGGNTVHQGAVFFQGCRAGVPDTACWYPGSR